MQIYTDDIEYAETIVSPLEEQWESIVTVTDTNISIIANDLFSDSPIYRSSVDSITLWQYLSIAEISQFSQYDKVNDLCRRNVKIPHGLLCLAGQGNNFHGFRNRHWESPPGNIYLTAYFAPDQPIDHFGIGFVILAAISVVDAIDALPGLANRAGIKWVNDILIDGAKVSGVLAFTQQEGDNVTSASLGIGINVKTTPIVDPTPFVPKAASLSDFRGDSEKCESRFIFEKLINALNDNYEILVSKGYRELLDRYRERSLIIGHEVEICSDKSSGDIELLAEGIVSGIGDNLELHLQGRSKPITRGRLILKS
ncbi:MAG: biotin--[acetyl-CoA-carboxylase] ligase [candidate division Zixibacteria bacterium]|nr:biotin--[acetyl-CoA-carboxylase] ligase [candidate division Zixibacteria bacterium]